MSPILLNILLECKLFLGLTSTELSNLLKNHQYNLTKYPAENIVALSGEKCNHLLIVIRGSVRGEMIDDSGKVIKVEEITSPKPIAHAFLFAKENEFPVTVTTLEDSEILSIEKQAFISMLQNNAVLLTNFLTLISDRSRFLSQKIIFLAFKTIKNKLAIFIIKRAMEQQTESVVLTETQQELADYFGVTRPALARSLSILEEEGVIRINKKKIEIKDLKVLKELAR